MKVNPLLVKLLNNFIGKLRENTIDRFRAKIQTDDKNRIDALQDCYVQILFSSPLHFFSYVFCVNKNSEFLSFQFHLVKIISMFIVAAEGVYVRVCVLWSLIMCTGFEI